MKYCVLSSGSKGNCTYIEINNKSYLIDVGCNFLYLSRKLKEINVDPNQISGIFLTHSHTDHTSALEQFIKKVNPKIYASTKIINSLKKFETNNLVEDYELNIDNLNIKTIILSHDVEECRGFIFNNKGTELVYITDTGYINEKYEHQLNQTKKK